MNLGAGQNRNSVGGLFSVGVTRGLDIDTLNLLQRVHHYIELLVLKVLIDVPVLVVHRIELEVTPQVPGPWVGKASDLELKLLALQSAGGPEPYLLRASDVNVVPPLLSFARDALQALVSIASYQIAVVLNLVVIRNLNTVGLVLRKEEAEEALRRHRVCQLVVEGVSLIGLASRQRAHLDFTHFEDRSAL